MHFCVPNVVKRVLHIIREVAKADGIVLPSGKKYEIHIASDKMLSIESLYEITKAPRISSVHNGADSPKAQLKEATEKLKAHRENHKEEILMQIQEILNELEFMKVNILEQATEYIVPNDVILTYDISLTLARFFSEAAKTRKFEVLIAESAPSFK